VPSLGRNWGRTEGEDPDASRQLAGTLKRAYVILPVKAGWIRPFAKEIGRRIVGVYAGLWTSCTSGTTRSYTSVVHLMR
jgi:hypothetical protein